jgi:hypothetical protein
MAFRILAPEYPSITTEIPLAKLAEYRRALEGLGIVRHDHREWYVQQVTISVSKIGPTVVTAQLRGVHRNRPARRRPARRRK